MTVGSMLPFDRLVAAIDTWAKDSPSSLVVGQIGDSALRPAHIDWREMLSPAEYKEQFTKADLVISHVGMGTIITAAELQKPLILLPRRAELHEVTSDHQMATARWLTGRLGVTVVNSENDLGAAIANAAQATGGPRIESGTRQQLIHSLRRFIDGT